MIAAALALAAPAAEALPDSVAAMIDTAYRSGDDKVIDAVLGVAKASFPDLAEAIEARAKIDGQTLAATREEERKREQAHIAEARFLELWTGEIELGAARSTGSTRTLALYAAGKAERDGIRWRQLLTGRADFQQTAGETTADRLVAAYQPQYKLDPRLYVYGLAQHERDQFLGYRARETAGTGFGYSTVFRSDLKVSIEGGPALRYTRYDEQPSRWSLAGRASVGVHWSAGANLTLSEDAALYVEGHDTTATSTAALDTKLIGALKARLSYNLQYERDVQGATNRLDTISRATLVYGF